MSEGGKTAGTRAPRPKTARVASTPGYEVGSGNVYADLGFKDAAKLGIKAQLVAEIAAIVRQRRLTQTAAAELLGIAQPKLSELLRGHFHGVSERRLLDFLTRLGRDVQIVVKAAPRSRAAGMISVVTA